MIRVILVEDEMLVREGLRRMIPWAAHGFTIVGEADNGEAALDMFQRLRPDVVFTDIRMPGMDGMTLISHIRELSPKTPVCVLSSHTEFALVKQGIRYGVFEYLDKLHLSSGEIEDCLERLKSQLEQRDAGAGRTTAEQSMTDRTKPHVELSPLAWIKAYRHTKPNAGQWCWLISEIAETGFFPWENDGFLGDFPYTDALRENRIFLDAEKRIHMILNPKVEPPEVFQSWFNPYIKCSFVVSGAVDGQEHLDMAYGETEELLTDLFYSGWNCYLTLSDKRIYRLQEHALEKENEEVLSGLLSANRTQESLHELKRVIDSAEQRGVHPKKLKQAVTMLLLRSVQPNKSDGDKPSHFGEAVSLLQKCRTREDFMAQLAAFLHDFADNTPPSAYSAEVSKGITFMEQHMGEKITLARLAEVTHLHPNYFATLFKEQTGQTPMGYLMELRMNRAKERLRHSNLYIQEIAEQVGFMNLSHFSRLFKQVTGQSPSEYRQ